MLYVFMVCKADHVHHIRETGYSITAQQPTHHPLFVTIYNTLTHICKREHKDTDTSFPPLFHNLIQSNKTALP